MTIMMNISGGARFVLAAALLNSSVSANPQDECRSDSTCNSCVADAEKNVINPFVQTTPCEYVENGGWDSDLQKCIEDSCSLDDGCVEELQKWVDSPTVCYRKFGLFDYSLIYDNGLPCYQGERHVVCNKAGGNEAVEWVTESPGFNYEKRCDVYNPPKSNNGGVTWFVYTDVMTGKSFSANCVDVDDPSLTTAICINEDDCSAHGKFSPKPSSSVYTPYNEEEDDEEEEPVVAEESDKDNDSPAEAITGNVGIFLSVLSLLYYAWL
jgi:hypothetical protein